MSAEPGGHTACLYAIDSCCACVAQAELMCPGAPSWVTPLHLGVDKRIELNMSHASRAYRRIDGRNL